eukprot:9996940-Ditylum_brightwellii.AAC.2
MMCPGNPAWEGHLSVVHPYVLARGISTPLQDMGRRVVWKESWRASGMFIVWAYVLVVQTRMKLCRVISKILLLRMSADIEILQFHLIKQPEISH